MRDDTVIAVMRRFKRELRVMEAQQMKEMTEAWLVIERSLEADIELLAREVAEMQVNGEVVNAATLARMKRYQNLTAQIEAQYARYASQAAQDIGQAQRVWGQLGIEHARLAIETASAGVISSFNILPANAVELMVGLLGDGSALSAVLGAQAISQGMVQGLGRQLLLGTARGWNPRKTARYMRDALAGGLQKALTIARTEQMRVYREANRQQMQESGVVEGYMRLATRDDRVCIACLALDGEVYELDEVMDEHPQGRCAQVPIVIGVGAPQWLKGPDWIKAQPESVQRAIMGNKRYELWRDGEVDLEQMVAIRDDGVWGQSNQVAPVKELAGG